MYLIIYIHIYNCLILNKRLVSIYMNSDTPHNNTAMHELTAFLSCDNGTINVVS